MAKAQFAWCMCDCMQLSAGGECMGVSAFVLACMNKDK